MGLLALARVLAGEALDAVYPPLCWLCRRARASDGLACAEHRIAPAPEPACRRCARPLAPALAQKSLCAECRRSPPSFRRLVALGRYRSDEPLRDWILALKHGGRRDLALPLGALLGARWREEAGEAAAHGVLVPVPLHSARAFQRGYDQARLLARHAGEEAGLEVGSLLERVRWTAPQGSSAGTSRSANVRGAFGARRRACAALAGRPWILVDDVVTSGATIEACIEALREHGPAEVSVLCLARAVHEPPALHAELGRARADERA